MNPLLTRKHRAIFLGALLFPVVACAAEPVALFDGKTLAGWDGDPGLWKVADGMIVGTCAGPGAPPHNDFLIWRGGVVKDFELTVTMRVRGDNNSGIQYRSRPLPEIGPWAIGGYQCDVHPAIEHTGMTYEEKGRGIFGLNGQSIVLDSEGQRWLVEEHEPIMIDVAEWNTYTVTARGNHLVHRINGRISSQLTDHDEKGRALEGLLAFQLHSGNANTVEIREVLLKTITDAALVPFSLPVDARELAKPKTSNPQGLGKPGSSVAIPAK